MPGGPPREYFAARASLRRRWRALDRRDALRASCAAEVGAWQRRTRRLLARLIGCDAPRPAALAPSCGPSEPTDGFTRQRVVIATEARALMPLFVLRPAAGKPPFPAVIACHGHGMGGKAAVAGCRDDARVAAAIRRYHADYGAQLARAGFMVFCPDARGFGERREAADAANPMAASCRLIANMAMPLGLTVTGLWVWDLRRLIDYIETRSDCVPGRIGCVGLSGGGHQTLWTAALDERIRCAVVSGYFYGCRDSLLEMSDNCACNYVPHLWEHMDMGDIGALIAPRPLLIETGRRDPLNGARGARNAVEQARVTRRAYRLLGAAGNLRHDVFEGGHVWHGAEAIPWLRRHLARAGKEQGHDMGRG